MTEPLRDAVLSARDLVKDYGFGDTAVRALDGVTIDIARGSFTAIMGPSGSGKSTLLHLLGGLDRPTSGEVLLEGEALSALGDREVTLARRRNIGFVFQFFNLVPVLTAAENVALPAVIDGRKPADYRARLDDVLDLVGLTAVRDKLPSEISGGQQQRVAIARALFGEPAVLLADEPTGNLDTRTGQDVIALLRAAQQDLGQTVVVVTHDPRIAAHADEVVLIRDGRIGGRLDLTKPTRRRRPAAASGRTAAPKSGRAAARAKTNGHAKEQDRADAVVAWLQKLGA